MEIDTPMETDGFARDPMETEVVEGSVEEGRSNTDMSGHGADSDSDADSKKKHLSRSQFLYKLPLLEIPDYRMPLTYPWEKEKEKEKEEVQEEEEVVYFLKATDISWSHFSDEQRKEGRWHANPRMAMSKTTAAFPLPETVVDEQPSSVCTSSEVLDIRVKMQECFAKGVSCRCLFRSKANKMERYFGIHHDEPYDFLANRFRQEFKFPSYAHVFPRVNDVEPLIRFDWIKPTTFDGDKQYLEFFPLLMKATKYGHTKDHVLAKAVVLATKSFQKMLFFQINIAVEDCMELLEYEERMKQRYYLYYFAASEVVLNSMDCRDVLKRIRDGDSWLPYYLTEFGSYNMHYWEGVAADLVDYLATELRAKQGSYTGWVIEEKHDDVAKFVIEVVDQQFRNHSHHLYIHFLEKKMRIAQGLQLLQPNYKNIN